MAGSLRSGRVKTYTFKNRSLNRPTASAAIDMSSKENPISGELSASVSALAIWREARIPPGHMRAFRYKSSREVKSATGNAVAERVGLMASTETPLVKTPLWRIGDSAVGIETSDWVLTSRHGFADHVCA